jgi:aminoglycoside phosphotransferase (APT) family kinase protein
MNDALQTLIRRLARALSLPFDPGGSEPWPCRAGQLFRVRLGDRLFALKLYDEGYFNDLYLYRALAGTGIPMPVVHASGPPGDGIDKPWVLMDWVQGNQRITDVGVVGRQIGQILRKIHAVRVDGAGGRQENSWEFSDWHSLVEISAGRDRAEVDHFDDTPASKAFYLSIVDEFAAICGQQPNEAFLLHGDLGLDNVIVHDDQVVAVIDAGWFVAGQPLLDLTYVMNSRLGEGAGLAGLLEGYGVAGLRERHDVLVLRMYHLIGKLIYFDTEGLRDKYQQRRGVLLDFAARHGFAPPA